MLLKCNRLVIICFFFILLGCQKSDVANPEPILESEKAIISLTLAKADNPSLAADVFATINADTIRLVFPVGSVLGTYIPSLKFIGKSITPNNRIPQNFASPFNYTVAAEDGSTKTYNVVTRIQESSEKDITAFQFSASENIGIINSDIIGRVTYDSIYVLVPFGTNLNNLKPSIVFTGKSISPSSSSSQNFTSLIQYTVTAQDGSTKNYKVLVSVQALSATLFINTFGDGGFTKPGTGTLYAIDVATGSLRWKYDQSAIRDFSASPAFSKGVIYTSNWDRVIAFDTVTKTIKWTFITGGAVACALAVVNDVVYTNSNDGYFYAIDANTGMLKWKFLQIVTEPKAGNTSSPTVVDGVVYCGSSRGEYVYALDAVTGNLKWKMFNPYGGSLGIFTSSPSVVNGVLYIGDVIGNVLALDITNGGIKWVFKAGSLISSSPTVVDDVVYIGSADKYLYAINVNDGTVKWRYWSNLMITGSPIVSKGVVYFANNGGSGPKSVYALEASTGNLKWFFSAGTDFESSPVVYDDIVCIASLYELFAIDANSGKLKWTFSLKENTELFTPSPMIVDEKGSIHYSSVSGHRN